MGDVEVLQRREVAECLIENTIRGKRSSGMAVYDKSGELLPTKVKVNKHSTLSKRQVLELVEIVSAAVEVGEVMFAAVREIVFAAISSQRAKSGCRFLLLQRRAVQDPIHLFQLLACGKSLEDPLKGMIVCWVVSN